MKKPILTIDDFAGIAKSQQVGFDEVFNCDISDKGAIKINPRLNQLSFTEIPFGAYDYTIFTADPDTDILTHSNLTTDTGSGILINEKRAVQFVSTVAVPGGLTPYTTMWLVEQGAGASKVASSFQNAIKSTPTTIDITNAGSGICRMFSVNPSNIKSIIGDPSSSNVFVVDSSGQVWLVGGTSQNFVLIGGNTLTSSSGAGIAVYKNYLFTFRNAKVDVLSIANLSTSTWTNDWMSTTSTSSSKHAIVANDDILYFCNGRYVGSIAEKAGVFDPSNSNTYTQTDVALDFAPHITTNGLAEFGRYLAIATTHGLYLWDKISSSYQLPTLMGKYIFSVINKDELLYGICGDDYTSALYLYVSNGTTSRILKEIPKRLATQARTTQYGISAAGNKIYFNLTNTATTFSASKYVSGTWCYDIETGDLSYAFVPPNGLYNNTMGVVYGSSSIGDLPKYVSYTDPTSKSFLASIPSGASEFFLHTNYAAYFVTPVYTIGQSQSKMTVSSIEVVFDRPLATGDAVRIGYRIGSQGSFTTLSNSISYTTHGGVTSAEIETSGIVADILQLKIEMTTGIAESTDAARLSGTTIKSINLYG